MKRVVIYDVESKKPGVKTAHSNEQKKDDLSVARRQRALKTIENASALSKIVKTIESLDLTDPSKDGPVIQDAVNKITTIIEEMKLDFKKDYWE